MLNKLLQQTAKTDDEYRKKLQAQIKRNIAICIVGLLPIIVGIFFIMRCGDFQTGFLAGLFTGTGAVIIAFSLKDTFKARKLLRNDKLLREERLKASDERTRLISEKSMYWAGVITMGVCYVVLLVSAFFNMVVLWTIWCVMMFFCIVTSILKKYFEKKM